MNTDLAPGRSRRALARSLAVRGLRGLAKALLQASVGLVAVGVAVAGALWPLVPGADGTPARLRAAAHAHRATDLSATVPPRLAAALLADTGSGSTALPVRGLQVVRAGLWVLTHPGSIEQRVARAAFEPGSSGPFAWLQTAELGWKLDAHFRRPDLVLARVATLQVRSAYGARQVAQALFDRMPADLGWAQTALLVVVADGVDPGTGSVAARLRRDELLRTLAAQGYLSRGAAEAAVREPLALVPR